MDPFEQFGDTAAADHEMPTPMSFILFPVKYRNSTHEIICNEKDTVEGLKLRIFEATSVAPSDQRLIFPRSVMKHRKARSQIEDDMLLLDLHYDASTHDAIILSGPSASDVVDITTDAAESDDHMVIDDLPHPSQSHTHTETVTKKRHISARHVYSDADASAIDVDVDGDSDSEAIDVDYSTPALPPSWGRSTDHTHAHPPRGSAHAPDQDDILNWLAPTTSDSGTDSDSGDGSGEGVLRAFSLFESIYGSIHPSFITDSIRNAVSLSKAAERLLLVFMLPKMKKEKKNEHLAEVLCDGEIVKIIDENFLSIVTFFPDTPPRSLGIDIGIGHTLHPPCMVAVGHQGSQLLVLDILNMVEMGGEGSGREVVNRLLSLIETHAAISVDSGSGSGGGGYGGSIDPVEQERRELISNQNSEYEQSLRDDMEKEKKKRLERIQAEEDRITADAIAASMEEMSKHNRKLPSGERIMRKFGMEDTFKFIRLWVMIHLYDEQREAAAAAETEEAEEASDLTDCTLSSQFPAVHYTKEHENQTLRDLNFDRQVLLMYSTTK